MTLDETVLQKVAEWRPTAKERSTLNIPDAGAGWAVSLQADRCDEVGCLLWEIDLQRTTASSASLALWADHVAERVSGLMESLQVVEIDAERAEALLRSDEPTLRGGSRFYYEVLLRGTKQALVRRYKAAEAGTRREQVAFALTHEALAKLVGDISE